MNENLKVWENIFSTREWGKYPPLALVRAIARHFSQTKDRSTVHIIELGSGTGANLWFLAREGFTVYGIEGSPTAATKSIERLKGEGFEGRIGQIVSGDYSKVSFPDRLFDAIIDVESLYCNSFKESQSIIRNAQQYLKPGGLLFSITFADGTWGTEGSEIDYHLVQPIDGPMANMGLVRFSTKEDMQVLYGLPSLTITNLERHDRILSNDKVIREWSIEAIKDT